MYDRQDGIVRLNNEIEFRAELIRQIERIADVQEALLKLAIDARQEKKEMAAQMKEVFRRPPEVPGA